MIAKTTHKEFTLDIEDQITMIVDETLIGQLVLLQIPDLEGLDQVAHNRKAYITRYALYLLKIIVI